VETAGELEELRLLGCDFARGYYWPVPGGCRGDGEAADGQIGLLIPAETALMDERADHRRLFTRARGRGVPRNPQQRVRCHLGRRDVGSTP